MRTVRPPWMGVLALLLTGCTAETADESTTSPGADENKTVMGGPPPGAPDGKYDFLDPPPIAQARTTGPAIVYRLEAGGDKLVQIGSLSAGTQVGVWGVNNKAGWVQISPWGQFVRKMNVSFIGANPADVDNATTTADDPKPLWQARTLFWTTVRTLNSAGELVDQGQVPPGTQVGVYSVNYGQDPSSGAWLGAISNSPWIQFMDVRYVDIEHWNVPWKGKDTATLPSVYFVNGDFYGVGAGILIGPNRILTARHLAVNTAYCFTREPDIHQPACPDHPACNHRYQCGKIAAVEHAPTGVDLTIVQLNSPEGPPYANLHSTQLAINTPIWFPRYSLESRYAFGNDLVAKLGNDNNRCDPWPANSSASLYNYSFAGGDSGGPVFMGDRLVGIVHGQRAKCAGEASPPRPHLFTTVAGNWSFIGPHVGR